MYEASGKFPDSSGELYRWNKIQSTGFFDECLRVEADSFQGKYCTAMFTLEPLKSYEIQDDMAPSSTLNQNSWVANYQLPREWFVADDDSQSSSASAAAAGPVVKNPKSRPFKDPGYLLPFRLPSIGYCIPSSCSGDEFASALAQLVGRRAVRTPGGNSKAAEDAAADADGAKQQARQQYKAIVTLAGDNYCYTREMVESVPDFDAGDICYM